MGNTISILLSIIHRDPREEDNTQHTHLDIELGIRQPFDDYHAIGEDTVLL